MKINIVGIDPAIRNFGYALATLDVQTMQYEIHDLILVESAGESGKQVRKNSDDLRRAKHLHTNLLKICQGSHLACVELPVGSQSARAMASYGMCVGILAACPIPMIQVWPHEVKMAAVGHKQAAKEEMIEWATAKYPNAPWLYRTFKGKRVPMNDNEHLADAVAAIEAGIKTDQFEQALAMWRVAA